MRSRDCGAAEQRHLEAHSTQRGGGGCQSARMHLGLQDQVWRAGRGRAAQGTASCAGRSATARHRLRRRLCAHRRHQVIADRCGASCSSWVAATYLRRHERVRPSRHRQGDVRAAARGLRAVWRRRRAACDAAAQGTIRAASKPKALAQEAGRFPAAA